MRPILVACMAAGALLTRSTSADAQRTLIRAGRLLHPVTGRVSRDQVIVVERGRVTAVGSRFRPAAGDSVIDLSTMTVLPGLIDAHVHLAIGGPPRANAFADLAAGFTTVVDLGARSTRLLALRDSINGGLIPGPRVLAAGLWVGRKDGVCEFNGIGIAGDTSAFRQRVRDNVAAHADVIKVCVSGWPADAYAHPDAYELPDSILVAIVDEARRVGRHVVAHDISIGGVRAALRAGVHGLAHSAYLDSAAAKRMRALGMFLIPTLASLTGNDSSAAARALVASTRLAYRTGVPLVFGTDAGVIPHGLNAQEFVALVATGISPLDAIRSATVGAARAFGVFEEQILVAVLRTRGEAYGMHVRREIERVTGRELAIGAVYATLDRLEAKGLVRSTRVGAEGPTRRLFELTASGARALTETNTMRERLWEGISVRVLTALARA